MVSFDDILFEVNDFGRYQKVRFFLICLASLLPPIVTYLHSYTAANPLHRCENIYIADDTFSRNNSYYNETYGNITFGKCSYKINGSDEIKCNKWVFDKTYYQTTLTEEWSMVCENSFKRGLFQTIYFSGYFVGSIVLGVLADIFGRRPIMLSSFLLIIIGGLGAAFGPQKSFGPLASYIIYAISRFLIAVGTRGINVTGYILGVEIVGKSKRTFAGLVGLYFFAVGQLLLLLLAFLIRDWRTLAWVAVIPTLPYVAYYFILPESPRWLITKNKHNEAFKIIKHIAEVNKKIINEESWDKFIEFETKKKVDVPSENLISVFKSPTLAVLTILLFFNWIVNNLLFYGVSLKSGDLGINPYLSSLISAFVEIPAYFITQLAVEKLGRKYPYFIFLLAAGLSLFSITFIDNKIAIVVMAMFGKFFTSGTYAIIYLYSTELFPTSTRNSCMGACSTMARIGSMVAPQINELGNIFWKPLPFLIFGISGILSALSALTFNETLNKQMPQNIKEAENLSPLKCIRKRKKMNDNDNNEMNSLNANNN